MFFYFFRFIISICRTDGTVGFAVYLLLRSFTIQLRCCIIITIMIGSARGGGGACNKNAVRLVGVHEETFASRPRRVDNVREAAAAAGRRYYRGRRRRDPSPSPECNVVIIVSCRIYRWVACVVVSKVRIYEKCFFFLSVCVSLPLPRVTG